MVIKMFPKVKVGKQHINSLVDAMAVENERCALVCESMMLEAERESGPEAAGWLQQAADRMRQMY